MSKEFTKGKSAAGAAAKLVPFYKEKKSRSKYVQRGPPRVIIGSESLKAKIPEWVPPTPEEFEMWVDNRDVVLNKNKKKEFLLTPSELVDFKPTTKKSGKFSLKIEVLHMDYQGFEYTEYAATEEELQRKFWTVASKLISHFCSPRIKDKRLLNKTLKSLKSN